jgi:membrane protein YdbS with pleckstrin-like domain
MSAHANTARFVDAPAPSGDVAVWRLYTLRAGYLLLVVGLGLTIWPGILNPEKHWALMNGVVVCMLGAMSALAVLGLRYPLQMLPLLFFELAWKTFWLLRIALPLWSSNHLDADTAETATECLIVVIYLFLIPWRYVFANYVMRAGDRWW